MSDKTSELRGDPFLEHLLRRKIPEASEIQLILFQQCNLACNFCGQDHKSKTGLDTIVEKANEIGRFIQGNIRKKHFVNVMGGEIFSDELPDHIFAAYCRLLKQVHFDAEQIDHEVHFNFATNFIFEKRSRVKEFIESMRNEGLNIQLSTSYDFEGRHSKLWSESVFKANIEYFSNYIRTVNVVLTRPSIKKMISIKDDYFEILYSRFSIFFEYFQPEKNCDSLMPTDDELLEGLVHLANFYPKSSPVNELVSNEVNRMTCYGMNSMTLLPSGEKARCRYQTYKDKDFKTPVDYQSNSNIIGSFLDENECLSCPWFQKCTLRCFVQADWANRVKSKRCVFKTFFENTIG